MGIALAAVVAGLAAAGPAYSGIVAQPVATGLAFPAGFTFAADGRIFYNERFSGRIRVLDPSTSSNTLFFTVPNLATSGEQGLLGIALHPNYPATPYVYVYATRIVLGVARNQVLRITDEGGTGTGMWAMFTTPAAVTHNGGRIRFGPDGRLYVVIGDAGSPANSQDRASRAGKVLRMTAWGAVPPDNPFAGSFVFASGIRNSFGFGFDPVNGRLWLTDNGPRCNDELNRISRGRNYGWGPSQTCSTPPPPPVNTNQDGPDPVLPQTWYTPPIAPTGLAFCSGCGLGAGYEGRLFFGAWNTGEIRRITLGPLRWSVASQNVAYTHGSGILALEIAPSGTLYLSDSSAIYKLIASEGAAVAR